MNEISQQIKKALEKKFEVKKLDEEARKKFSWPIFLAGDEYNQELTKLIENNKILGNNVIVINFSEEKNKEKEYVEEQIKNSPESSIIWFKNIDKIEKKSPLQKSLLAIFDPAQNYSLSIKGETIDLSKLILIVTSSTHDTSQLSNPLFSRLDCINVDTAKPKEFFWDKYFYSILIASLLVFLMMIALLVYFSDRKKIKKEK